MTRKSCCCGDRPDTEEWFCCDPRLKNQFVTIFDKWMDSAVPVSPNDLIVLRINRPLTRSRGRTLGFRAATGPVKECGSCCTPGCAPTAGSPYDPCTTCPKSRKCIDTDNGPICGSGSWFAPVSFRGDICGESQPCCDICGASNNFKKTNSFLTSATNLFLENISGKRVFQKPLNRILQNPPSFLSKANPTSLEDLNDIITFEGLNKRNTIKINSEEDLTTNNSFGFFTTPESTTQNENQGSGLSFGISPPDSNQDFQYKVTQLYPGCLKCLEDNGYDIDCIRRNNYLEKCKTSKSQTKDFCDDCAEECAAFCNAYFGDTWRQRNNISMLMADPIFTENYEYVRGSTLLDPELYLGVKVASKRVREYVDPLRETLNNSGADYDFDTYKPTETLEEKPYFIDRPYSKPAPNPEIAFLQQEDGDLGEWDARNNGSADESSLFRRCDVCNFGGGSPGADPLYMIYRFTGCHIKWYPPEYIFNYNTRVNQGQGYFNEKNGFLSCDYFLRSPLGSNDTTGYDNYEERSCYVNAFQGAYGTCTRGTYETSFGQCQCKDRNLFPCQCYRYPHVSGGLVDTVKKRFNVSQRTFVGGYFPYQDPFAPKMKVAESGCMSCYNSASTDDASGRCTPYFNTRRASLAAYPTASGRGKGPPALGAWCNRNKSMSTEGFIYNNPNYQAYCFNRGISPYLSRVSLTVYQSAREIFHYGSTTPSQQEVLSIFYQAGFINYVGDKWTSLAFTKNYNKKSNLFHKMVGLVSMEYHFECWAYHSNALFATQPPICMNHKNAITLPFERPYAGTIGERSFTYDPREAFRYFAMRHYPRRVMYGSSSVPVFHSDLYAMEILRERQGGRPFVSSEFLEKFYLYFYNMVKEPGDTIFNEPAVDESQRDMYEEVAFWIREMIYNNILSVKDHAPDIANELKSILEGITGVFDPITQEWSYIFPDPLNEAAIGNQSGLTSLINWIYQKLQGMESVPELPGYNPNDPNLDIITYWETYLKPYINAKFIKENLINPQQAFLPSYSASQPIFAGPRRAKLWPTPQYEGLTAWGCDNSQYCNDPERRRSEESALNIKTRIFADPENDGTSELIDIPFEYNKLFTGQEVYFAVTNKGKVRAFGKYPPQSGNDNLGPEDPVFFPESVTEAVSHDGTYYFNGTFNGVGVDAVPTHLSVASEGPSAAEPDNPDVLEPLDGVVEKVCNKGKFAVALVSYEDGTVYGPNYFECAPVSDLAGNNFNSDDNRVFKKYSLQQGTGQCTFDIVGSNGSEAFAQNEKWKKFSNSGWQIFTACLNGQPVSSFTTSCLAPFATNCAAETDVAQELYTIKSWGEPGSVDYGIFYFPSNQQGLWAPPTCLGRGFVRPTYSNRPYLMNKFFIWSDVACGTKHTIAITSDGALFATPDSDNQFNQSTYGFPTLDGNRHYKNFGSGNTMGVETLTPINFYYHYPKPAYFNDLTEEEWQKLVLRNVLQNVSQEEFLRYRLCNPRRPGVSSTDAETTPNTSYTPCDIRCHLYTIGNNNDQNDDCGLYSNSDYESRNSLLDTACVGPYGYNCREEILPDAPVWTDVAAGHYHSIALSSDNNLKIWGSYVKVGNDGDVIQGGETFESGRPIPVFLPEGEIYQDTWTLSGKTLGCGWAQGYIDCAECSPNDASCLSNCKNKTDYEVYTDATKTIFASKEIILIDGGPDYSIMARKAKGDEDPILNGRDGYKFVVWGNSEMVSAVTGEEYNGFTAQGHKYYSHIEKITAGTNAIGVIYRNYGGNATKLDIFERPGANTGVTDYDENAIYADVAFTNGTAAALTAGGLKANTWKAESFDSNTHDKLQFKNFNNLPLYFRSQAFFSAVPGTWDFSKWIFGGPCNKVGEEVAGNIVGLHDPCSVYNFKDLQYGGLLSYSGHPQYYWMRGAFRRSSPAVPTWSYTPGPATGCGLLRDRYGRDGLRPFAENGTGVQEDGNIYTPIAQANRALSNVYGSCFGGDICWVGDGSFSPYPWYRLNPEGGGNGSSAMICTCWDKKCGCAPSCRKPTVWDCSGPGFVAVNCFGDVGARNGFAANKDYFVQSAKSFGTLNPASETSGRCCGVIATNITAFLYAKRSYYYGYNDEQEIFEVKDSPYQYRATAPALIPGQEIDVNLPASNTKDSNFRVAIGTPNDAINRYSFLLDTFLNYPPVYVGGSSLNPLEKDVMDTLGGYDGKPPCDPCNGCSVPDSPSTCNPDTVTSVCTASAETLMGPGGWIHSRSYNADYRQAIESSDGFVDNSTVVYIQKQIPKDLLPTSLDSLGPLLNIGPYNGPVPPNFWGCTFWKDTIPSPEGPTCGCFRHYPETGVCPNGEQECFGCVWRPKLGDFGGVTVDSGFFTVYGATGIDVLDAYFNSSTLSQVEQAGETGDGPQPAVVDIKKLFRMYQIIPNINQVCGDGSTGVPEAFASIGGITTPGIFEAECISLGPINNISLVQGGINYTIGDILAVVDGYGYNGLIKVTGVAQPQGRVTEFELIDRGTNYSPGIKTTSIANTASSEAENLKVTISITPTTSKVIAKCMAISCDDPDNPDESD